MSFPTENDFIGCKLVFRTKLKSNGELDTYKARLIAKGLISLKLFH